MPLASLFGSHPCERHGLPECVLPHTDVLEGKTASWTWMSSEHFCGRFQAAMKHEQFERTDGLDFSIF